MTMPADRMFVRRGSCPACDGTAAAEVYRRPLRDPNILAYLRSRIADESVLARFEGTDYVLRKCAGCGLIFQENILSDEFLSTMYNVWIVHREEVPQDAQFFGYYANELFTVAALLGRPIHLTRVLDFGMGAGKWARVARAVGFDTCGTDLSDDLLRDAAADGIEVVNLDELAGRQFDFINTEQVFEHLARPREWLERLLVSLAPGGFIKISVPDGRDIERRLPAMDWTAPRGSRPYLIPVTPLVHINTFTADSIANMGARFGLEAVRPSLRDEYMIVDATSLPRLAKSILRPLYRRWTRPSYVFLRRRTD
jgi:2-polyprenyl-3-methyl-5-hydroxy-6-metoxy-1,4-benzoquinol methylase